MKIKKFLQDWVKANTDFVKGQFEQRAVNTQRFINYRELYQKVHEKAAPCFVLSTGRSGTALLTKLFEAVPEVAVHHEPVPEMVWYSRYAYENQSGKSKELEKIVDAARYEYIRDAFINGKTFVETNNRITFFAPQLAKLYPRAKFIHVIRNPQKFIRSGMARHWYTGNNLHDEGRIEPLNKTEVDWDNLSHPEKIAWLWNETNQFVEDFKATVSAEQVMTVHAHELFRKSETMRGIFTFCGLEPLSRRQINAIISKPVNAGKRLNEIAVSQKMKEMLVLMEKYGYSF